MTPSSAQYWLLAALSALALGAVFSPWLGDLWTLGASILLAILVGDALLGWRRPRLDIQRHLRHSLPVGVWSPVTLSLTPQAGRPLRLWLHDHHPAQFEVTAMPSRLQLPDRRRARLSYRVRPQRRGQARFTGVELLVASPLGLWWRKHFYPLPSEIKVFPNFREISHYSLLARDNQLSQLGVRRRPRRGEGNDFHQLREYRAGDALRQIDWKASSRYQRLISREYQYERDQQLVFLLDCGRRMRHEEAGRVHFDQVLNAMLLLAHVAARQGDAVGFMAFGGVRRWYPPRKQSDLVGELLEQVYDLETTPEAADYLGAARELMPLQRRRALVLILTNTRDEDQEDLRQAVKLLTKRHLVVVADLREALLDETIRQPVRDFDGALRFHAVNHYLGVRHRNHERLRHHGAITLDLLAPQLPAALVNNYLAIKDSGAL